MKKIIPLLFITFAACTTLPPTVQYDVVLKNDETGTKNYGPASSDLERCDLLRAALKDAQANDTILLGAGRFECDGPNKGTVLFPENVTVVGKGMGKTHLRNDLWSDDQGLGFELKGGYYSDLTMETQDAAGNEDARTVGLFEGYAKTPDNKHYLKDEKGNLVYIGTGTWNITMERVEMIGSDWVWYHWNNQRHHFKFVGCHIVSGRQGISLMNNNLGTASAEILDSVFDIDTSLSDSVGWTSNRVWGGAMGVVQRGGSGTVIKGNTFNLKCQTTGYPSSYAPKCTALFDGNNFGSLSGAAKIEFTNNTIHIDANPALSPDAFDIFMTNAGTRANLVLSGNTGSGVNGEVLINPMPTPTP